MKPGKQLCVAFFLFFLYGNTSCAQVLNSNNVLTRADTLRGTITPERAWWDVVRYDLTIRPDYSNKTIAGYNTIRIKAVGALPSRQMQLDLQSPMTIDSVIYKSRQLEFKRAESIYLVTWPQDELTTPEEFTVYFHGTPRAAKNAPWDGGWIWKQDAKGRPWMSVAVQGLGASAWFPCKDHQSDEPDAGASLTMIVPDSLVAVANGKLINKTVAKGLGSYTWEVKNPINNYNIVPYIGKYVSFSETYNGEKGPLQCNYWVLDYNVEAAKKQFAQAPMTIKAFEYWFGPFPWYEDDFKLVEAPHLGMEHQSAVAYGNKFQNGYLGRDLSGTGVGNKWDFIIVHEVGHEWFANNITTKDIADMWVHEGFTSYSETLFTEFHYGKEDANRYLQGLRRNIENKTPIIGTYGVNREGSGDMYYKGSNMLHTIRQLIGDDVKFRNILRGLNSTFYHQTVTSKQVEDFISSKSGIDLSKVFDQYLRNISIPLLEVKTGKESISFRWSESVDGFNMPVRVFLGPNKTNPKIIQPRQGEWTKMKLEKDQTLEVDANYYVLVKKD
ncbi:MAG TPA: M1 family metallopeptidase [Flavisolibacter sp.]|nr:M1 family metallopeptidase [Flavisolibacter sp.]